MIVTVRRLPDFHLASVVTATSRLPDLATAAADTC